MIIKRSEYTGGIHGWGTMLCKCANCGEIVAEYECDENGRPIKAIFNHEDEHECE